MFRTAIWFILVSAALVLQIGPVQPVSADDAGVWTPPAWLMDPTTGENYSRLEKRKAITAQKAQRPQRADIEQLKKIVHYHASQLTYPENSNLPKTVIDRYLSDLLSSLTTVPAREEMIKELMVIVPDLLTHPDLIVQENAVLMLVHSSVTPVNIGAKLPPKPFDPAYKLFVQILEDSSKHWVVRNAAVLGLRRILQDGNLGNPEKSAIAEALLKLLNDAAGEKWWFRFRIVETLGEVQRIVLVTGAPTIIEALMDRLSDEQEDFIVRAQAARSISQLPLAGVNGPLLAEKVGQLLAQMSEAQSKSPQKTQWRQSFGRVYLMFRPSNPAQAQRGWGLLYQQGNVKSAAQDLWKLSFPVLKEFVEQVNPPAVSSAQIKTLNDWVTQQKKNVTDRTIIGASKKTY